MAYCTASDVASLNRARVIGVGQGQPGLADVQTYIDMTAGEIDAILVFKGYTVPVNVASWPEAGALLRIANAKGGVAMMEEAAPQSPNLDRFQKAWDAAKEMLADAKFVMNADMDVERSEPRGPWSTLTPSGRTFDPTNGGLYGFKGDGLSSYPAGNNPRDPFFSRQQRF